MALKKALTRDHSSLNDIIYQVKCYVDTCTVNKEILSKVNHCNKQQNWLGFPRVSLFM